MNNNESPKERTTIYLSPEISKLLRQAAKDEDRSMTKQIERILKDWLIEKSYLKK
ncbi:MAG: ribbon-helix-helix protein, CopG family [Deltaproteobacteria bacterium]|nr:ribbon-helix-helix protein, CopG family [Deltaproteobacteria bacterium]